MVGGPLAALRLCQASAQLVLGGDVGVGLCTPQHVQGAGVAADLPEQRRHARVRLDVPGAQRLGAPAVGEGLRDVAGRVVGSGAVAVEHRGKGGRGALAAGTQGLRVEPSRGGIPVVR